MTHIRTNSFYIIDNRLTNTRHTMNITDTAQSLYRAYATRMYTSKAARPLVWLQLPEEEKQAWEQAAITAIREVAAVLQGGPVEELSAVSGCGKSCPSRETGKELRALNVEHHSV